MADAFVEQWTESLRASRAKTCHLLDGESVLTVPAAASSSTSSTLPTLAVRGSSFWRTSQASLLPPPPLWTKPKELSTSARPPESWENWPTAGGMRNGSLFQRQTWVPAMGVPGGSALRGGWATPDCNTSTYSNGKMGPNIREQAANWPTPQVGTGENSHGQISGDFRNKMEDLLKAPMWSTPTSSEHTGAGHSESKQGAQNLRTQVDVWPTPKATDGTKGGPNQAGSKGDLMLPSAAAQWPTPDAALHAGGNTSQGPAGFRPNISLAAAQFSVGSAWPTPAARDSKGPNSEAHVTTNGTGRMHMDQLANFVAFSPLVQQTPDGEQSSPSTPSSRRHLNPLFGSWLMGWPSTWVIAEPHASSALATASFHCALQQRLSYFFDGQAL